jgi:2',3'-cyclic-nucleotide 2'-phosphodiesterase (5'-nucleotidase family)
MKNRIVRTLPILIALSLIIVVISGLSNESIDQPIHLVILHTNDTHGKLLPYNADDAKDVGGMARVATLIKEIKKDNPGITLALHAGDEFSRGDEPTICFGGEANMLAMQDAGFDAFTPGNGDFQFSVDNLLKQTSLIKFPVLQANVVYKSGKRIFPPYVIREISGIKIAILGLGVINEGYPSSRPLKLNDPIQIAKELLPEIMGKSDLIIALTHIGIGADVLLAEKVPTIDVIVGGHMHIKLDKPMLIPRKDGNGNVVIVQAGDYSRFLGQLDIYAQKNDSGRYEIIKSDEKFIPIDNKIKDDESVSAIIKSYSDRLSEVIYTSDIDLPYVKSGDCPVGNFVANIIRIKTHSDVALLDRESVQKGIKKGEVTLRDVCNTLLAKSYLGV